MIRQQPQFLKYLFRSTNEAVGAGRVVDKKAFLHKLRRDPLCGEAGSGVGAELNLLFLGELAVGSREKASNLNVIRSGYEEDAIEAVAPGLVATGVLRGEEEGGLDDDDGVRVGDGGELPLLLGEDRGMNDGVQFLDAGVIRVEGQAGEGGAIEFAAG